MCDSGLRVEVFSGNGKEFLGAGTMVGFVPVYIIRELDSIKGIYSSHNAEVKPEGVPDELITKIDSNPKIKLDDGKVVYGCQVYWKLIEKEE